MLGDHFRAEAAANTEANARLWKACLERGDDALTLGVVQPFASVLSGLQRLLMDTLYAVTALEETVVRLDTGRRTLHLVAGNSDIPDRPADLVRAQVALDRRLEAVCELLDDDLLFARIETPDGEDNARPVGVGEVLRRLFADLAFRRGQLDAMLSIVPERVGGAD